MSSARQQAHLVPQDATPIAFRVDHADRGIRDCDLTVRACALCEPGFVQESPLEERPEHQAVGDDREMGRL